MKTLPLALLFAALASAASAAPSLRGDVTVNAAIVTVGDMFDDAGSLAEMALFRAPAPGTTGIVGLDDVRRAALSIGLTSFENVGYTRVRVARASSLVDATLLGGLVSADLMTRGYIATGEQAEPRFDLADIAINAEAVDQPARLLSLRYLPESGTFAARFDIAGIDQPIDLNGVVDLMVPALKLVTGKPAGTILTPADLETALVPKRLADAGDFADLEALVGQQLKHQSGAGMMLKLSDVMPPTVVARNALVTVIVNAGPMTLTVLGQALGNAAAGEPVDVLNTVTKKVLHGIARADGSVEISSGIKMAGL